MTKKQSQLCPLSIQLASFSVSIPSTSPNEGKLVAIVAAEDDAKVLKALKVHKYGQDATIVGRVTSEPAQRVLMKTIIGSHRVVDVLMGEMLPRIC